MAKARPITLLMFAALAATRPALADDVRPDHNMFEVGLFTGAFIPSKDHELYDSLQSFQTPFQGLGLSLALRASYFPLSFVGAEVEGTYMPQRTEAKEKVTLFSVRGHLMLQIPWRISPFFVAGGGLLGLSSASGRDTDRSLHWGVGTKFYIKSWLSVRLDGRHIISAAEGRGEGNTNHFEVTAGLSFTLWRGFGGSKEEPDEPVLEEMMLSAGAPQPIRRAMTEDPAARVAELLRGIHFAWDSAELRANALPALDLAVELLQRYQNLKVYVLGHTDNTGTGGYNMGLSETRARAVAAYLIAHGVDEPRVQLQWYGEDRPIDTNLTDTGRAKNRRTEFEVINTANMVDHQAAPDRSIGAGGLDGVAPR